MLGLRRGSGAFGAGLRFPSPRPRWRGRRRRGSRSRLRFEREVTAKPQAANTSAMTKLRKGWRTATGTAADHEAPAPRPRTSRPTPSPAQRLQERHACSLSCPTAAANRRRADKLVPHALRFAFARFESLSAPPACRITNALFIKYSDQADRRRGPFTGRGSDRSRTASRRSGSASRTIAAQIDGAIRLIREAIDLFSRGRRS